MVTAAPETTGPFFTCDLCRGRAPLPHPRHLATARDYADAVEMHVQRDHVELYREYVGCEADPGAPQWFPRSAPSGAIDDIALRRQILSAAAFRFVRHDRCGWPPTPPTGPWRGALLFEGDDEKEDAASSLAQRYNEVVQFSLHQLNSVLRTFLDNYRCALVPFGSWVTLGWWCGKGDVDVAIVPLSVDGNDPVLSSQLPVDGGRCFENSIARSAVEEEFLLRMIRERLIAFGFDNIDLHGVARVPVLKYTSIPLPWGGEPGDDRTAGGRPAHQHALPLCDPRHRSVMYYFDAPPMRRHPNWAAVVESNCPSTSSVGTVWLDAQRLLRTFETTSEAVEDALATAPRWTASLGGCSKQWMADIRPEVFHVSFDLTLRPQGVRNSRLIKAYFDQEQSFSSTSGCEMGHPESGGLVRTGYVILKHWAAKSGVANGREGWLTSYAFALMWIYYLLHEAKILKFIDPTSVAACPGPLPPPYRAGDGCCEPGRFASVTSGVTGYCPGDLPPPRDPFPPSLAFLVHDCLHFFAFRFSWAMRTVTLCQPHVDGGAWRPSVEVGYEEPRLRLRQWRCACIQDPYETSLNLARHLSPWKLRILRCRLRAATVTWGRFMEGPSCNSPAAEQAAFVAAHEKLLQICFTDGVGRT